jgi:hypothetical protein
MEEKALKNSDIQRIEANYGKPNILFSYSEFNDRDIKEGAELSYDCKRFHQIWKLCIFEKKNTGNMGSVCLACYSFLKKGPKMVSLLILNLNDIDKCRYIT